MFVSSALAPLCGLICLSEYRPNLPDSKISEKIFEYVNLHNVSIYDAARWLSG